MPLSIEKQLDLLHRRQQLIESITFIKRLIERADANNDSEALISAEKELSEQKIKLTIINDKLAKMRRKTKKRCNKMIQKLLINEKTESLQIIAENQEWDTNTLKELREKHNIIFMTSGSGIHPIMVIPREINDPLIVIGSEDDGCITFEKHHGQFVNSMDVYWIDSLIADLKEAKKFAKANEKKNKIS